MRGRKCARCGLWTVLRSAKTFFRACMKDEVPLSSQLWSRNVRCQIANAWTREISLSEALCIYNFPSSSDKICGAPSLPSQLLSLNIFVILASIPLNVFAQLFGFWRFFTQVFLLLFRRNPAFHTFLSVLVCCSCCSNCLLPFFVALFGLRNLIMHTRHTASYFGLLPLGRPVPSSTTSPVACQCGCFLVLSGRAKPKCPAGMSTGCLF